MIAFAGHDSSACQSLFSWHNFSALLSSQPHHFSYTRPRDARPFCSAAGRKGNM